MGPTAAADADPWYSAYGHGYGYGHRCGGYRGYYGKRSAEAEAEPTADATANPDADAWYSAYGHGYGYGLGHYGYGYGLGYRGYGYGHRYGGYRGYYGKRSADAEAEPTADPTADADAWYSAYGHGYGYGLGHYGYGRRYGGYGCSLQAIWIWILWKIIHPENSSNSRSSYDDSSLTFTSSIRAFLFWIQTVPREECL